MLHSLYRDAGLARTHKAIKADVDRAAPKGGGHTPGLTEAAPSAAPSDATRLAALENAVQALNEKVDVLLEICKARPPMQQL